MLGWILATTFCCCVAAQQWKVHILQTPIVSFFPNLKLHHVAILTRDQKVYALDFTHRDASLCTKMKLLLGATVPAKIRLRRLREENPDQTMWENASEDEEELVSEDWSEMNLYFRNCRHFSRALVESSSHPCTHAE